MEKCSISVFLILCGSAFVLQCNGVENWQKDWNGLIKRNILRILKYLNQGEPYEIFYTAEILKYDIKGDILKVFFLSNITCNVSVKDCNKGTGSCRVDLKVLPNEELQIQGVVCMPYESAPMERSVPTIRKRSCTGCFHDVNINAEGIESLVESILQHVQSDRKRRYILLEVLRLQRQVVNGVNFIMTVKMAPAMCHEELGCVRDYHEEDIYCLVKFFQKPGYEEPKNIISNNCTNSQFFVPSLL